MRLPGDLEEIHELICTKSVPSREKCNDVPVSITECHTQRQSSSAALLSWFVSIDWVLLWSRSTRNRILISPSIKRRGKKRRTRGKDDLSDLD